MIYMESLMKKTVLAVLLIFGLGVKGFESEQVSSFTMPEPGGNQWRKISDAPTPAGFTRVETLSGSFAEYLRDFPLRPDQDTVFLYDGRPKWNQRVHCAILDIEIGKRDLQQCADVVMHMRAEYLWKRKEYDAISFDFVSGKKADYREYAAGDYSMRKFLKYLTYVYSYANTSSLRKQMRPVDSSEMQIGDVFVQAGRPYGHAMIVVDMARNATTGENIFMLAQGFIPAQDGELVINPNDDALSPWFSTNFGETLRTPQWLFYREDLRRFRSAPQP